MPRVSINETNKTFQIIEGEILYHALSEQGEELPHGCLSGSCGACKILIIEGKDNLSNPSVVEQDTIDSIKKDLSMDITDNNEIRLSCRARVNGDISFKILK